jgi:SAM-dependent methyltransferase
LSPGVDLFHGLGPLIERDPASREALARRVANRDTVLDVGGRNGDSRSARWIRSLCTNPATRITCTDVGSDYGPDLVDDISDSRIPSASFDGVFCVSILEHVADYRAALAHMDRILKPGGEIILYVPFCWPFHDRSDHHRFTFTEVARFMAGYEEFRLCLPDDTGYGGVVWQVLTFFQIHRLPVVWRVLAALTNAVLLLPLSLAYLAGRRGRWRGVSWADFRFYFIYLHLSHGFWAWGRKRS